MGSQTYLPWVYWVSHWALGPESVLLTSSLDDSNAQWPGTAIRPLLYTVRLRCQYGSHWPHGYLHLFSFSFFFYFVLEAFLVAQMVKNPPAKQETWVWSLAWEDPLEKGMATHSSLLAWRTAWTAEAGGLQSMGSQRVRLNGVTNTFTFIINVNDP